MTEPIQTIDKPSLPDPKLSTVDKLRMLLDITKTISRSLDLDEVLTLVMDTLGSLIRYDAAGIYLIESSVKNAETHYIFKSRAIRGYLLSSEMIEPLLKLGEGFIGYVAQTGKPLISPDVSQDPRYFAARTQTKSEMVAPIISNDEVIGVFDLESDKLDAYNQDDLSVLQLLASQVAIIIEKVELHDQLIEKNGCKPSLKLPARSNSNFFPRPIRKFWVLTSARIFFRPKKFPVIIMIGSKCLKTRSELSSPMPLGRAFRLRF
ncbi:MAG: GAF domain-containing protein [Pyrinomonadaceae bacterium]